MDKEKLIEKLRSKGFKVSSDSSVVIVLTNDPKLGLYKTVKEIIKSSGYNASWGVKYDASAQTVNISDDVVINADSKESKNGKISEKDSTPEYTTEENGQMALSDFL